MYVWIKNVILMLKLLAYITQETFCFLYSWSFSNGFGISLRWFMLISFCYCYLVDPGSSHTLVLKIKPCMSKCFVFITLDCGRLIITVIVLLRLLYRWIPVVILELIHVTKNIFFYILSIYLSSNQNALALWMIHSNVWRTL